MDANEILTQAKAGTDLPTDWRVFPLLPVKIAIGLVGWTCSALLGSGLFTLVASLVIPYNYQRGIFSILFTSLLLAILLFIGLGSLWTGINDCRRLHRADRHIIVITSEDFVKQEGEKIVHVPLINVRHVTVRGYQPPDRGIVPSGSRRMRTPTTLAFIDTRSNNEVLVVNDTSYGDPSTIAAFLKRSANTKQELLIRTNQAIS